MKLKVCGITTLKQALSLVQISVDFIGFIGYKKSPRYAWDKLNPKDVATINNIQKVGVFVNESPKVMLEIAEKAQLDYVQLHGNESLDTVRTMALNIKVIKAISVGEHAENIQQQIDQMGKDVTYFLFDTATINYGGSGKQFNWHILNNLNIPKPYFLSGGIDLDTEISSELFSNPPFALDINSKFEVSPGVKDINKIEQFINNNLT